MNNSDVTCIVNAEGEQSSPEKYLCRLKDQENFKCIALVVLYNKEVAGYVCIYPYSTNGILGKEGFSEIADFGILEKYKDLGIEKKLLDIAEKVASEYANTAYLSVGVHNVEALNMYFKRGYIPDRSGAWYQNAIYSTSLDHKNENESTVFRNYENDPKFFLYKKLELTEISKFPMKNKITTKSASLEVIIHRHRFTFLYHQIQNFKRGENI